MAANTDSTISTDFGARGTEHAAPLPPLRRYFILGTIVLGTTLFVTSLMVASTLLPQLQGAMSASPEEISWIMTFNILATAVVTPLTGWLTAFWGRRTVMLWCISSFTIATWFCGAADSLESLLFWRILQGAVGAPILPLSQAILLSVFPPRQHPMVLAVYGMGVVMGQILGPAGGGFIAEIYDWRWAFYVLALFGLISFIGLRLSLPADEPGVTTRFDWLGFLSLGTAIACLQLVLSRGQRLDWYGSNEIILETAIGAVAFYLFIAHNFTSKNPFLTPRLLLNRNYVLGLMLVGIFGALNITPMVTLPPLLRQYVGFPDMLVGLLIASRGIGALTGSIAAIWLARIDGRVLMTAGFSIQIVSGLWLMTLDLNLTPAILVSIGFLQGIAIGIIWVPLSTISFASLSERLLPEATGIYHLIRNLGASLFISICVAEIVRTTTMNYGRMAEFTSPFNEVLSMPWVMGAWSVETTSGLARLSDEITRQAVMLGYLNTFVLYTIVSAIAIPLVLMTGRAHRPVPQDAS